MVTLLLIIIIIAIIEKTLRPRIEKGRGGWILWYGSYSKRKFIIF